MWAWIDFPSGEISAHGISPVEKSRHFGHGLISPVEKFQIAGSFAFLHWRNPDNACEDGFPQWRNRIIGISPVEKSRRCGHGLIPPREKFQLAESWAFLQWRNPENVGEEWFPPGRNFSSRNYGCSPFGPRARPSENARYCYGRPGSPQLFFPMAIGSL
jgi:hypothetical protein